MPVADGDLMDANVSLGRIFWRYFDAVILTVKQGWSGSISKLDYF
jgi:hypothetical protein